MNKKNSVLFVILALFFFPSRFVLSQEAESWQKWLEDVEPIITSAEQEVFKTLKTEEDRIRFISSFWRARSISWIITNDSITRKAVYAVLSPIEEEYI